MGEASAVMNHNSLVWGDSETICTLLSMSYLLAGSELYVHVLIRLGEDVGVEHVSIGIAGTRAAAVHVFLHIFMWV
jgi:hypothetical protein